MKITSKEMYKLSNNLIKAGDFRLWLANIQRSIGLNKWADNSVTIAVNCFEKSKDCKRVAYELYTEGL